MNRVAYYEVDTTSTSITITIRGATVGKYYRFFCNLESGGDDRDQTVYASYDSVWAQFDNLIPDTAYAVNCGQLDAYGGSVIEFLGRSIWYTDPAPNPRPDDWYWGSSVSQGRVVNIAAQDWNNFLGRINQFRIYRGLGYYTFRPTAATGQPMTAEQARQAREAISQIPGHGPLPAAVYSGDPMTAVFMHDLADALNSID